jgi:hypothetical protein
LEFILELLSVDLPEEYQVPTFCSYFNTMGQWFSTFLSLWHTYFERKFGGTLKGKKEIKR